MRTIQDNLGGSTGSPARRAIVRAGIIAVVVTCVP